MKTKFTEPNKFKIVRVIMNMLRFVLSALFRMNTSKSDELKSRLAMKSTIQYAPIRLLNKYVFFK